MQRVDTQTCVLVVDPNPITLLGTAGVLDSAGYACTCARTAEAALQAMEQPIDLVVMEVGEDAEASLASAEALKSKRLESCLPVVLIADPMWAGLEKRCEQASWMRCMFKPIDPNVLLDVVNQALWMPQIEQNHRKRGVRPARPGWIQL